MPKAFDDCVFGGGRVRTKDLGNGKYIHVCFPKGGGASVAGEVKKKENMKWHINVITEDLKEQDIVLSDKVKIKGLAIKARESRNGVVYEIDELSKAANTLLNKSIALNHSDNVEDVVGTVTNINVVGDGLEYEGVAYNTGRHPYVVELLKKGLIKHVSIEATAPTIEAKENKRIAKNLEFLGLAFVRHPGIPEATASVTEALERVPINEDMDMSTEHKCPEGQKWDEKEKKCMMMDQKDMDTEKANVIHTDKLADIKPENQVQPTLQKGGIDMEKIEEKVESKEIEQLKQDLSTLREELKKLQETPKSKGIVTEETQAPSHRFSESFSERQSYPSKTFIMRKIEGVSEFFPVHPAEWY